MELFLLVLKRIFQDLTENELLECTLKLHNDRPEGFFTTQPLPDILVQLGPYIEAAREQIHDIEQKDDDDVVLRSPVPLSKVSKWRRFNNPWFPGLKKMALPGENDLSSYVEFIPYKGILEC